jgi:hypothetical protein
MPSIRTDGSIREYCYRNSRVGKLIDGYPQGQESTEEVAMPNEMPAITMAFVLQIWFLAVLVAVGAIVWRQAHPRDETGQTDRARR